MYRRNMQGHTEQTLLPHKEHHFNEIEHMTFKVGSATDEMEAKHQSSTPPKQKTHYTGDVSDVKIQRFVDADAYANSSALISADVNEDVNIRSLHPRGCEESS